MSGTSRLYLASKPGPDLVIKSHIGDLKREGIKKLLVMLSAVILPNHVADPTATDRHLGEGLNRGSERLLAGRSNMVASFLGKNWVRFLPKSSGLSAVVQQG